LTAESAVEPEQSDQSFRSELMNQFFPACKKAADQKETAELERLIHHHGPAISKTLLLIYKKWIDCRTQNSDLKKELRALEEEHSAHVVQLVREQTDLQEKVQYQKKQIQELRSEQEAADRPLPTVELHRVNTAEASSRPERSTKLPDPEVFKGEGVEKWRQWNNAVTAVLKHNNDRYPSAGMQKAYVMSRLGGTALSHALNAEEAEPEIKASQLLEVIRNHYEDHFAEETAREEFDKLRQGNRLFEEFYSDFVKFAARGKISQSQQLTSIRKKLNNRLQDDLINFDALSLTDFVQKARSTARRRENKTERTQAAARFNNAKTKTPAAADTTNADSEKPTNRTPAWHKTAECFYCRQTGHISANCPSKKARSGNE
jgi:Zinc knuckle